MDDVAELLKTWELPDLIPIFAEQRITIQALSALTKLTNEDLKDLIPQTGPRVLFTRCWRTWKAEFSPTAINNSTFSGLDLSNLQFDLVLPADNCLKDPSECMFVLEKDSETEVEKENVSTSQQDLKDQDTVPTIETQSGVKNMLLCDSACEKK